MQSSVCEGTSALGIMKLARKIKFMNVFPNLSIALPIYVSLTVANSESEQSFSNLSLKKNRVCSNLLGEKLNFFVIMSVESYLLHDLPFEQTISDYAKAKPRMMSFKNRTVFTIH